MRERIKKLLGGKAEKQPTDKEIKERLDELLEEGTPLPGNICKEPECGGQVIKEVMGLSHGRYIYGTPSCSKCGRLYLFAENAPRGSAEQFWKMMHRPITI